MATSRMSQGEALSLVRARETGGCHQFLKIFESRKHWKSLETTGNFHTVPNFFDMFKDFHTEASAHDVRAISLCLILGGPSRGHPSVTQHVLLVLPPGREFSCSETLETCDENRWPDGMVQGDSPVPPDAVARSRSLCGGPWPLGNFLTLLIYLIWCRWFWLFAFLCVQMVMAQN